MKSIYKCVECGMELRLFNNEIPWRMRSHYQECHPEKYLELLKLEKQRKELKKEIQAKFPHCFNVFS